VFFVFYFISAQGSLDLSFAILKRKKKSRDDCSIVDLFQVVLIPWWVREEDTFTYTHTKNVNISLRKNVPGPLFFVFLHSNG
jgi:hypothetical protein